MYYLFFLIGARRFSIIMKIIAYI